MPVVTQSMRRIGDALIENRDEVEAWSERFADGLEEVIPKLGKVASGIGDVTSKVWEGVDAVAEMVGGYENLGKIIAGVFAFRTIWKIGRFAWAVGSAAVAMGTLAASTGLLDSALGRLGKRSALGAVHTGCRRRAMTGHRLCMRFRKERSTSSFRPASCLWRDYARRFRGEHSQGIRTRQTPAPASILAFTSASM